jgi:LPPG:FO 2-phospho-L-lactate transferase
LSIEGVRAALKQTDGFVIGVSPIVAGAAIKGPADRMLRNLGVEVSAFGVAQLYRDFLDAFVLDSKDVELKGRIEALGLAVNVTNTLMRSVEDKVALAETVLKSKASFC